MKKRLLTALYFLIIVGSLKAQKPEILLDKWATAHPVEKVWLHLDRDEYAAGETAWFKAYLASDNLPDTISTTLYVQLLNKDLTIVAKAVLPVLIAGSNGQLDLPDTLTTGMYTIRAFTPSMMLNAPDFIFKKGVYVYGRAKTAEPVKENKVHINFFPEGGNLVSGFNNTVAFKVNDDYGFPVAVSGSIKNSKGEVVTSFSPLHAGMGLFELAPVAGEKYYAVADNLPDEKFILPDVVQNGITLTILSHPQGYYFEIQQRPANATFTAAYIIGQMQNRPVFKLDFSKQANESQQGVINTLQLHSGIMQVTVFNKDGMPLAERLCFINNKEYIQPVTFLGDTVSFKERGRNRFSFLLSDTVEANMSVSVTDAAYEQHAFRRENIFTGMLLTSDIKGYVHNPSYYFSADTDSVKAAVDLVMMTNGWRRFAWKDLGGISASPVKPEAYITLSGRATLRGTNRPFDSKPMLLLINGMGQKKRSSHILQTDGDGKFILDSLVFYDRNKLLFSDIRGKKSQYIDITLSADSLHKPYAVKGFSPAADNKTTSAILSKWKEDYASILKANGSMLEGVTVKAQRKSPMEILDDKYTTGMFSGDAVKAIDLVSSDEADPYNNIFDYLQARVNGLTITNDADGGYGLFYRQGPSLSSMGNIPMTIFLDEIETDAAVVATIPGNQVALVKIYQTFVGGWGNAPGGAISIYTKKGEDYRSSTGYANFSIYNGYSVIKEFYAPNYKNPKPDDNKADNRVTLDWRPNVIVNSINPKIPLSFYNNDRTKMFKVVVEGMTSSGKLIWLEKMIKP